MKLARRLVFGFMLGAIIVLAVNAAVRVKREVNLFDSDTRRDNLLVGRAMAASIARVWGASGREAGLELVDFLARQNNHVQLRWVYLDAAPGARGGRPSDQDHTPLLDGVELETARAGSETSQRAPSLGKLLTYVPLRVANPRPLAIELDESLEAERRYVRSSVVTEIVATGAMILIMAVLASLLGRYFVGQPFELLVGKVRRAAAGDLSGPLAITRGDETGELAGAVNAMCENIAQANQVAREQTAARIAAVEQLRHADRLTTVGKLASGVAHELGTPLNVVAGRAQMIASGEAAGSEARSSAEIITEQARRMTQIIRQVLDYARRRVVQKSPLDLYALAEKSLDLLRPMAAKRAVRFVIDNPEGSVVAVAEEGQIQQALMNLIINAIQASDAGGVISVGFENAVKRPPPEHGGTEARYLGLRVSDTGHGMTVETQARIFDPFFTTKDIGEGTGLGLSIAYGIARDHGGWIGVESSVGEGSRVTIYLPKETMT